MKVIGAPKRPRVMEALNEDPPGRAVFGSLSLNIISRMVSPTVKICDMSKII
jgi:hypothetical protein